jgi:hypothetical protein
MTEKTKVDIELPIRCSTVKSTVKYFDLFLTMIGHVIWSVVRPVGVGVEKIIDGIATFFNKHMGQIFGMSFMFCGFVIILGAPANILILDVILYYVLGMFSCLLGLIFSTLASVDHYNIDLTIRCKKSD